MAEYIELSQATTLFGDVDTRFDTTEGKIPSNASSGNKMVTASDIATKADLVNGLVPANQLPSFVDDVLMGTAQNITETAAGTYSANGFIISGESTPTTLEDGKTYVDTATNIQFRYTGTGSNLVSMGSNLALGETTTTAYAGNKGKANADAISDIQDVIPSGASTSNKLATASDIPDTSGLQPKTLATTIGSYTTVEGALSGINDGKVDKVTGKGLSTNDYDATAKGKVDGMDASIAASQNGSTALTKATVGWTGKNLYAFSNSVPTPHGITITANEDGSFSGTAGTTNAEVIFGDYAIRTTSEVFPNAVAGKRYRYSYGETAISGLRLQVYYKATASSDYTQLASESSKPYVEFTMPNSIPELFWCRISIANNVTVSAFTAYPMVTDAAVTDSTYEPYHESVEEWGFPRSEQRVLGVKNLWNVDKTVGTTGVGLTLTHNSDTSITLGGTTTAGFNFPDNENSISKIFNLEAGRSYILSTETVDASLYKQVYVKDTSTSQWRELVSDSTNAEVSFTLPSSFYDVWVRLRVNSGSTINSKTFYPMLRLASDPDSTYVPFAMSNRETTEFLSNHESEVTNIVEGATVATPIGNHLYKSGRYVQLCLDLTNVTATAFSTIVFKIPSGFRPKQIIHVFGKNAFGIKVTTNGDCQVLQDISAGQIQICTTWITT